MAMNGMVGAAGGSRQRADYGGSLKYRGQPGGMGAFRGVKALKRGRGVFAGKCLKTPGKAYNMNWIAGTLLESTAMQLHMLKSKLHQACITHADVSYEGSIGIDTELVEAVALYPFEKVLVANVNNGARFETYVIPEPFGSRRIVLNGAAARMGVVGDRIIIMSYCWVDESIVREGKHRPRALRLDEHNEPIHRIPTAPTTEEIASMIEG